MNIDGIRRRFITECVIKCRSVKIFKIEDVVIKTATTTFIRSKNFTRKSIRKQKLRLFILKIKQFYRQTAFFFLSFSIIISKQTFGANSPKRSPIINIFVIDQNSTGGKFSACFFRLSNSS